MALTQWVNKAVQISIENSMQLLPIGTLNTKTTRFRQWLGTEQVIQFTVPYMRYWIQVLRVTIFHRRSLDASLLRYIDGRAFIKFTYIFMAWGLSTIPMLSLFNVEEICVMKSGNKRLSLHREADAIQLKSRKIVIFVSNKCALA